MFGVIARDFVSWINFFGFLKVIIYGIFEFSKGHFVKQKQKEREKEKEKKKRKKKKNNSILFFFQRERERERERG